jgi:hypothetical protein
MKVKDAKQKRSLWIGQINLMGRWMDQHDLPYKKDDVTIIPDNDNSEVTAYEFPLDPDALKLEANQELMPGLLESGGVKVTFFI